MPIYSIHALVEQARTQGAKDKKPRKKRIYVGKRIGSSRLMEPFTSETEPTQTSHGKKYAYTVGPFTTRHAANIFAASDGNSPTIHHVSEWESYAKNARTGYGDITDTDVANHFSKLAEWHAMSGNTEEAKAHAKTADAYRNRTLNSFARTVGDLQHRNDLTHVVDSQDVQALKEHVGKKANAYDSFLASVGDGDYKEVYGMEGTVPHLSKRVTRII